MKKILTFMAILAVAALSLSADIYVKSKTHTDAMSVMGQNTPAKDDVSEQWIRETPSPRSAKTRDHHRLEEEHDVYHQLGNKTYVETPLPLDYRQDPSPADGGHGRHDDHDGDRHARDARRRRSATGTARATT